MSVVRGVKKGRNRPRVWLSRLASLQHVAPFLPLVLLGGCGLSEELGGGLEGTLPTREIVERFPGGVIDIAHSRFEIVQPVPEYYSSAADFPVRCYFRDVDSRQVREIVLWCQVAPGAPWTPVASVHPDRLPIHFQAPGEGSYGLRGSVAYVDGTSAWMPRPEDKACVWIHIDRTPPQIRWRSMSSREHLEAGSRYLLEWDIDERRFPPKAVGLLEWSPDGGSRWVSIGRVPLEKDRQRYLWQVPNQVGDDYRLRLRCTDFAGNEALGMALGIFSIVPQAGKPSLADRIFSPAPDEPIVKGSPPPQGHPAEPVPSPEPPGVSPGPQAPVARLQGERPALPDHVPPPSPGDRHPPLRAGGPGEVGTTAPEGAPVTVVEPISSAGKPGIDLSSFREDVVLQGGALQDVLFRVGGYPRGAAEVEIAWDRDGSGRWEVVAQGIPADSGKASWRVPVMVSTGGRLRVTVSAPGIPSSSATSLGRITIDCEPPEVEIRGLARTREGKPALLVSSSDGYGIGLRSVSVYVTRDGGQAWEILASTTDADRPIPIEIEPGTYGFWVVAVDRFGHASTLPRPGATPQKILSVSPGASLRILGFAGGTLRAGEHRPVLWTFRGYTGGGTVRVEISEDDGRTWTLVSEEDAARGKYLWRVPSRAGDLYRFRVGVRLPDGTRIEDVSPRFAVIVDEAARVTLAVVEIPERVSTDGVIRYRSDGVGEVEAFYRGAGDRQWVPLPAAASQPGIIRFAAEGMQENEYELLLRPLLPPPAGEPGPDEVPSGRFAVDRTSPRAALRSAGSEWLEGGVGWVRPVVEGADSGSTVRLEVRPDGSAWEEAGVWPKGSRVPEDVPVEIRRGWRTVELRMTVEDAAGNTTEALLGPVAVTPAIAWAGPGLPAEVASGDVKEIRWEVPRGYRGGLVTLEWRKGTDAQWSAAATGIPADGSLPWTVPDRPGEGYRVRLVLAVDGKIRGQTPASAPFDVAGRSVSGASRAWTDRAFFQLRKLDELMREGSAPPERIESLAQTVEANLRHALGLDPQNGEAYYGLGRLWILSSRKDWQTVTEVLEKASGLLPDRFDVWNDLGAAHLRTGQFARAEHALQQALAIREHPAARFNRGLALYHMGRYEGALPEFRAAVRDVPAAAEYVRRCEGRLPATATR